MSAATASAGDAAVGCAGVVWAGLQACAQQAPTMLHAPVNVQDWAAANARFLQPPICNKLLHKRQLSVMFVGGPNSRTDFHSEAGPEFFFQLRGDMQVVTIQRNERKLVDVCQGFAYVLPGCVRHSPQRAVAGSLGLVVERERLPHELDSMCWYTDFSKCDQLLFERYFKCRDLGQDLVPIVSEFNQSSEKRTNQPDPAFKPLGIHTPYASAVPDPVHVLDLAMRAKPLLDRGDRVRLFPRELGFEVVLEGRGEHVWTHRGEVFLFQLQGSCAIGGASSGAVLRQGECVTMDGSDLRVARDADSIGLVVTLTPHPALKPSAGL
jgi:3-hydroxyanthranilate 3,4-dioxygenase